MRENIYFYLMKTLGLFILSVVLLQFNTTKTTSVGGQLFAAAAGGAVHKCMDKERQALLDFKAKLQYPKDGLSTWRSEGEDDCCKWRGVTCNNQTGHVKELDLTNYSDRSRLRGEISLSLLNLTYLNRLDLSSNSFYGNISLIFSYMTQLTYLNLGENQFSGVIPMSIGNMTQLTFLHLGGNEFVGSIPISIGNMTKLKELYLQGNSFSGFIPWSIGSLTELGSVDLGQNNFSGTIPSSIGFLTQLMHLDLSQNSLFGTIPPEFGNLTNLVELHLIYLGNCTVENVDWLSPMSYLQQLDMTGTSLVKANYWVNVIIGLQHLEELALVECNLSQVMHPYSSSFNSGSSSSILTLDLDNNNLNSSLYCWLCPLIGNRLVVLSLSGNTFNGRISEFLDTLSGCTSTTLEELEAISSQFTGLLPHVIQNFSSLIKLDLASNQLHGSISDHLWVPPLLELLDLSSNYLRGSISENIGNLILRYIDLSDNLLEGVPFDADMSNLSTSIQYIAFSSCKLGPRFPKWIQNMKKLEYLDFSKNNISDAFPTDDWNHWCISSLRYLSLSSNNISGKLPDFLSNANIYLVDLSSNNFYGPIPSFPMNISSIDLSRNKLDGGISLSCERYKLLEFLDLSYNSLNGKIPDCLQNLNKLTVLNLGHNILSGWLPPSIGYLGQLEMLSLYNNTFTGKLPLSLKYCTKLSLLDLGANKFYGNVPAWIGENLSRLYVLSLRSNKFSGTIPIKLCNLANLQILDLSINNLNGTIPSCVINLTTMVKKRFFSKRNNSHHYQFPFLPILGGPSSTIYGYSIAVDHSYIDDMMIEWQGKVNEFRSNLGLLLIIDLSNNNLTGQIPYEITNLHELLVLDLSNNALDGKIPQDICKMTELLTLNLSRNMISGEIPSTMSQMDTLNDLDLSYNNLSGRIPSSTQLQSFPPERFAGNSGLCGLPTTKKCLGDEDLGVAPVSETVDDGTSQNELWRWFYIGGATGFATAFWIACSVLFLNRRLRHAFFNFQNCLKDWVYVKVLVFIAKLQRVARA